MNCKPGDLAVIVRASLPENVGRMVTVISFNRHDAERGAVWNIEPENQMRGVYWYTDAITDKPTICPDAWLRPIRPGDGADETLTWAGKPAETVRELTKEIAR